MNQRNKDVAEKLRFYREACALSHQQVADALHVDRSSYSKYESGSTAVNIKTLLKLAQIFNVNPTDLLPDESDGGKRPDRLKDSARADSPIYQLSKDERGLIARYRVLSKAEKKQVLELMGNLSKKDD